MSTEEDPSLLVTIATLVLQVLMVIGPITGYVDQYRVVNKFKSSQGFSIETCGVLLVANIVRIFFWLGKRFDTTLLFQSILMIAVQLVLLEIVVRYRPAIVSLPVHIVRTETDGASTDSDGSSGLTQVPEPLPTFWYWPRYVDYLAFLGGLTAVLVVLYMLLGGLDLFTELLGVVSLGIESTLPIPQCLANYRNKSVEGFSHLLLALWILGDSFKFFYFLWTGSPLQFTFCGAFQLSIDFVILAQFIYYSPSLRLDFPVEVLEGRVVGAYEPIREEEDD
ncbi:PQ loop repeat-domain-containing protein [Jimgerdemannia flammicorona]|uniref:PQ loop repeat-domain-containing protein n=1 Tax=Jimgerdemannia flammicorona TaxID=994334 RepID=A0A433DDE1_9FUNG|nr:PQ loop repeat-domain-containing protein [Jimgerdemannia flammicorona]